jgi:hypothetical protein
MLKTIGNCRLAVACTVIALTAAQAQDASSPTLRAKEKAKAEAQVKEEQEKAEIIARKMKEPFWKRLDEAMLEQLERPLTHCPHRGQRRLLGASRQRRSTHRRFQPAIGRLVVARSSGTPANSRLIH